MSDITQTWSQFVRKAWSSIMRRVIPRAQSSDRGVILHDPAASRPRNLDDPFFDQDVQERMAEVIAKNATKKK